MTAVMEDTDLGWVSFLGDEPEICQAEEDRCRAEAVAASFWKDKCRCSPDPMLLCAGHRDRLAREAIVSRNQFQCDNCGQDCELLRIEALR